MAVVIVSLFGLTIPLEATAARVGSSVTQILSITTIYMHERTTCPNKSGLNLLSYYILACFSFTFVVIIETYMILLYKRKARWNRGVSMIINGNQNTDQSHELRRTQERLFLSKADWVCFVMAIVLYICFNFTYFVINLHDI